MNCLNWYEASAFCIWDGGFLPTEAEWIVAAVGGNDHRAYPWSQPPTATDLDCSYANQSRCVLSGQNRVGSESPKGDGKYGHADLVGNVSEWLTDSYYMRSCFDCAYMDNRPEGLKAGISYGWTPPWDSAPWARYEFRTSRTTSSGARCARAP